MFKTRLWCNHLVDHNSYEIKQEDAAKECDGIIDEVPVPKLFSLLVCE